MPFYVARGYPVASGVNRERRRNPAPAASRRGYPDPTEATAAPHRMPRPRRGYRDPAGATPTRSPGYNAPMIEIDGKYGEGGGQILRTSLALSAVTGKPFRIYDIRHARPRPGLGKQHLECVRAAGAVSGAVVRGHALGSREIVFEPGTARAGEYEFNIESAGSTLLVLQTVFPILSLAGEPSEVRITGGTHNTAAPPFDYVVRTFLPSIRCEGFDMDARIERHGFYPRGGGAMRATVLPRATPTGPIEIVERRRREDLWARVLLADLPHHIAEREARVLSKKLGINVRSVEIESLSGCGPGNAVIVGARYGSGEFLFTSFGEMKKRAEKVAGEVARSFLAFHRGKGAVEAHLADQILLYMAMSGRGTFTTGPLTKHTETNIHVVESFLPVRFSVDEIGEDSWKVSVCPEGSGTPSREEDPLLS